MSASVTAYHGWGFNAEFWQPWSGPLAALGVELIAGDRGYFASPTVTQPEDSQVISQIIFTHSFGLHLCPASLLETAKLLVIFSGFAQFHPAEAKAGRRSRLILNQMIQQFQVHPQTVLQNFWMNCFHPFTAPSFELGPLQVELLLQDLQNLNDCNFDLAQLINIPKIITIHGSEDQIVSPQKGWEWLELLPSQVQSIEIKGAGHALPITHFETCWRSLSPFLLEALNA